jgi:ribonuclease D
VLYLHALRDKLRERLVRDGRIDHANACFTFLPTRAKLDLLGWEETDIFAHS